MPELRAAVGGLLSDTDAVKLLGAMRDGLGATLDMLRSKGVSKYREDDGRSFAVEFFPSVAAQPEMDAAKPDPNICRCGHFKHEHGDHGLCLIGCDPEKCAGPEGGKSVP